MSEIKQKNINKIKAKVKISVKLYHKDNFGIYIVSPISHNEEYEEPITNSDDEFTIKGNIPNAKLGDIYNVIAEKVNDDKYGLQYNVIFMNQDCDVTDKEKQKIFLKNILTEKQLEALYDTFDNPFELIQNEKTEELTKVKGIGVATVIKLIDKYKETIDFSEAYVELDGLGLTHNMIKKLCETYGSPQALIDKFKENPYTLSDDVDGIGFERADQIALKSGVEKNSVYRIRAYIMYYLNQQSLMGNSWVDTKSLVDSIIEKLDADIEKKIIGETISQMTELWISDNKLAIGLKSMYELERKIANEIKRIQNSDNNFLYGNFDRVINELEDKVGFEYTDEQKVGIKKVLENQVCVITGLSGTGKTSIVKAVIETLKKYTIAQTALSGRASSRMTEITGMEGFTIHRLLGYIPPNNWVRNKNCQLDQDIIIVDETSMIDSHLFYKLISAVKDGAKLILLGDYGQLESIGCGNIFYDLIHSNSVPLVKLTKIHRQAQKSAIITQSKMLRENEQIIRKDFFGNTILGELQDLELEIYDDKDDTAINIIKKFKENLPKVKSILDIQIIVPMKDRGISCTYKLNNAIQKIYNPDDNPSIEVRISKDKSYFLKEGDKVINRKNNYQTMDVNGKKTPIFNGNIGIIRRINIDEGLVLIKFMEVGDVIVKMSDIKSIQLGYATTVHVCQGSQFERVIFGLDYGAYMLLTSELVYTAITRASKYCVLCAENKALRYATSKSNIVHKKTFLQEFLKGE